MNTDISPIIPSKYYIYQLDYSDVDQGSYTVAKKGCYICSIAMIICWYLGDSTAATKKALIEQMAENCSSSGSYSGADVEYNDRTFRIKKITDLAAKLLDGKPSICEVPGHFVVINGYDTDNEDWAKYLVLDPGHKAYTNLQEVMDKYDADTIKSKRFVYEV